MQKISLVFLSAFLVLALASCTVQGVVTAQPAEVIVTRPPQPRPEYIWVTGEWIWQGNQYAYREGHWERPRPSYAWIGGHWQGVRGGWRWIPGHWVRR